MPAPLPLFEIDAQLEALEAELLDAAGVVDDETSDRYDALLDARDDKALACLALIRRNAATADAYAAEAKRLADRARAHQRTADRVRDILLGSMLRRDESVHETPLGRVRVQYASTRSVVLSADVDDLPERFRVQPPAVADKRVLADALKADDPEARAVASLAPAAPFLRIL